jgi:hypothetical protein
MPWAVVGLGTLGLIASSLWRGSLYERGLPDETTLQVLSVLGLSAAVLTLLTRPSPSSGPLRVLTGIGATLWFSTAGYAALDIWWCTLLPLCVALVLLDGLKNPMARNLTVVAVLLLTASALLS